MPNHNISFVKANDAMNFYMTNDNMNDGNNEYDNLVNFIDVQPHQGQTNLSMNISFSQKDIIKHAPNDPLYIVGRINDNPTNGMLIDLICVENVITE
jgi:hypothetical protein